MYSYILRELCAISSWYSDIVWLCDCIILGQVKWTDIRIPTSCIAMETTLGALNILTCSKIEPVLSDEDAWESAVVSEKKYLPMWCR